jgi:hypothetical protein
MAKSVSLVHPQQTFQVLEKLLVGTCDLFRDDPTLTLSPYTLTSQVSLSDVRTFVSAVEGASVAITNDNLGGLSHLCEEFQFRELTERLSQFRESDALRKDGTPESENDRILIRFPEIHHQPALFDGPFTFSADGAMFECDVAQAIALSSAVSEQLSVDACARTFTLKDVAAVDSVQCLLDEGAVSIVRSQADLGRQLGSLVVELKLAEADRIELTSIDLSKLSAEALDEILAGVSFSIASEDALLEQLLSLGDEYHPLLNRIEIRFLSAAGVAILAEHFVFPPECVCCSILDRLLPPPPPIPPFGWNSAIVPDFPTLFEDFMKKEFTLLWRGSRDGFRARDFHSRCNGHPNTLTVILDRDGNIFGGFTPVEWESRGGYKTDPSLKSFVFTLKNPHNVPARRFALHPENKYRAIYSCFQQGPTFCSSILVTDNCNANTHSCTDSFGKGYRNDTGLDGKRFFTGFPYFQVKEIEVFEITE